ncbi:unnamed protein product [Chrysoparadoxa australica]
MKCIHASAFGAPTEVLSLCTDEAKPQIKAGRGEILVRVLACSLSPADSKMLSGDYDAIMKPAAWPYVPGMDLCGIVEGVDAGEKNFKKGDCIIATNGTLPVGGMAEYAVVNTKEAVHKPERLTPTQAAAFVNTSMTGMCSVRMAKLRKSDRVLVVGASGGVGTSILQLAKSAGVAFLAGVSTQEKLVKSLGADKVINYKTTNYWELPEFQQEKFDVIFDCVGAPTVWGTGAQSKAVLKNGWNGGRYIALVMQEPMVAHNILQLLGMVLRALGRYLYTLFNPFVPRYKAPVVMPSLGDLAKLVQLADEGQLGVVLDPASPFPFTTQGVQTAFELQASGRAHGKIVVQLAEE